MMEECTRARKRGKLTYKDLLIIYSECALASSAYIGVDGGSTRASGQDLLDGKLIPGNNDGRSGR